MSNNVRAYLTGEDWADGELVSAMTGLNVAARELDIRHGKSASPVTEVKPTVKISRKEKITRSAIGAVTGNNASDGAAGLAALHASSAGLTGTEAQSVGLFGGATNTSSAEGENAQPDASGVYGVGRITGGTSARASSYGGVFYGRRDVDTAICNGIETSPQNYTGTAESYEPKGSFPSGKSRGIWMPPGGESDSACGIAINNAFGVQYDVGIGFGNLVNGGKTGAIKSSSIRDDSTATTTLDIRGTHTDAVKVGATAGPLRLAKQAEPSAPEAGEVRFYADESGGKVRLMARFPSGAALVVKEQA